MSEKEKFVSNKCFQFLQTIPNTTAVRLTLGPLDELLAFIEGDEEGEGGGVSSVSMTTNNPKPEKKKKKTKKSM